MWSLEDSDSEMDQLQELLLKEIQAYVSLHQKLQDKLQTSLAWSHAQTTSSCPFELSKDTSLSAQLDYQKRMRLNYFQTVLSALKLKLACMAKTLELEDIVKDSTDQACSIEWIQWVSIFLIYY